jgi:hypothetical protein
VVKLDKDHGLIPYVSVAHTCSLTVISELAMAADTPFCKSLRINKFRLRHPCKIPGNTFYAIC